ncbi:family 16 glycosylhydrolase [Acidicapsa dinghuensis]|uniref:Family 16 glycosylhydrolase n=1 Tax=Acidicapsa dinghuensis TaxID=2218256 RepID=A0ABW1EQP8_9BACT|nr:family 16 glycosylhydrolase [Acidicapsa dinghuensis]
MCLIAVTCFALTAMLGWERDGFGQTGASSGSAAASHAGDKAGKNGAAVESVTSGSGDSMPLGAAAPTGQKWHVVADDRFDRDDSIHSALWNGGTGGGMPVGFCGTEATSCGYTGRDCQSYFGTYPEPPYAAIDRGLGLAIQAMHAPPGDTKYRDNQMADIQSYGKITIHAGSFVEWEAKMPTDRNGEGDGWHVDLWCSTLSRHRCDDSAEVDVAEKVLSKANSAKANYVVHDQPVGVQTVIEKSYSAPGGEDLSAGFHTYGLLWSKDKLGKEGSFQAYIDGKPIADHAAPINDPSWESGAYCYAGWMQQELEVFGGGAKLSSTTSSKDPLIIKRFTVWQAY